LNGSWVIYIVDGAIVAIVFLGLGVLLLWLDDWRKTRDLGNKISKWISKGGGHKE